MSEENNQIVVSPQEGKQTLALNIDADVIFAGGSAGSAKSYTLLMRMLRHMDDEDFDAIYFRRTTIQLKGQGGLWDNAKELYSPFDANCIDSKLEVNFPSGAKAKFHHMELEKNKIDHQGLAYSAIFFDELTHFCLTEDHEVLTSNGWKNIAEVVSGEEVYTLNDDKTITTENCEAVEFPFEGELLEVDQRNGISFKATKDHRMVIQRQDKKKSLGIKKLHSWGNDSVVRVGDNSNTNTFDYEYLPKPPNTEIGSNANIVDKISINTLSLFLGWYLSKGCNFYQNKTTNPKVSIRQTKEEGKPYIRALFDDLGYRWSETEDGQFNIFSRQLFDYVEPLGNTYTKRVPSWVFKQSKEVINLFLQGFCLGDGHQTPNGAIRIGLANEGLIDDLQQLYFLTGRISTKGAGKDSTKKFNFYRLNVSQDTRTNTTVKNSHIKKVYHKGKVYCLVCPKNKNFYVRRKGRCFWSGNSETQFTYLLSRLRSKSKTSSYVMASMNPDADTWVQKWVKPFLDEDGYFNEEMAGVLIYFVTVEGQPVFAKTREELIEKFPNICYVKNRNTGAKVLVPPKSFTFLGSTIFDNQILIDQNPNYLAELQSLPELERARLLHGNWYARAEGSNYFDRNWLTKLSKVPTGVEVRGWDKASSEPSDVERFPDFTTSIKMIKTSDGRFCIVGDFCPENQEDDGIYKGRFRKRAGERDAIILKQSEWDGKKCKVILPVDVGSAGKTEYQHSARQLIAKSFIVRPDPMPTNKSKVIKYSPFSSACQAGLVDIVESTFPDDQTLEFFYKENEAFTGERSTRQRKDDWPDTCATTFNYLNEQEIIPSFTLPEFKQVNPFNI